MSDTPQERRTRPFADFLLEHNKGAGHQKAGEALQRVVGAVRDTGKKGSVTITVNIEPMKQSEDALVTTVVVAEKIPTVAPKGAIFYADEDHNLQRTDPQQLEFEGLREVDEPVLRDTETRPAAARVVGGDQ